MDGIVLPLPSNSRESPRVKRGRKSWRSWWTNRLTLEFVQQTSKTMTEEYLYPCPNIHPLKPSTRTFSWGKRAPSSAGGGSSWQPDSHSQPLKPTWALVKARRMARVFFTRRSVGRRLALAYFSLSYKIKRHRHVLHPVASSGSERSEHEQCSCEQHGSERV